MVITSSQGGSSFNILGSSKLNTIDGKNPSPANNKPASAAASTTTTTTTTAHQAKGKDKETTRRQSEADRLTACQKAHDALEARLRDEELNARSRGWS